MNMESWRDNWGGTQGKAPPTSQYGFDLNYSGGWNKGDYLTKLLGASYPGALDSLFFASGWGNPRAQQETVNMYDMLAPTGARARVDQFGAGEAERAATSGRQAAGFLSNLGYGKSAQSGALLDSVNQGRERTSDFAQRTSDPLVLAQQRSDVVRQSGMSPALSALQQLLGQYDPAIDQKKGGGFLDSILGIAGAAGGMGWNPFAQGKK